MKTVKRMRDYALRWAALAFFMLQCCGSTASAATVDDTIVLKQKCTAIGGVYTVSLSKTRLRIDNPHLVIFAQAPTWSVTAYNPQKKVYLHSDFKSCMKKIQVGRSPFSSISASDGFKPRKARVEIVAGLPADRWVDESASTQRLECWTLKGASFPPQCAQILTSFYGIPSIGDSIPIRFTYRGSVNSLLPIMARHSDAADRGQKDYQWLETLSVNKQQPSAAMFVVPKGFRLTQSYAEVAVQADVHHPDTGFILKDLSEHPEALFDTR